MNCLFCADPPEERKKPDPSPEKVIEGLENTSFKSLIITGGEPTIYSNLLSVVSHAKNIGYKWICIATNGLRLADKRVVDKLYQAGVDSVQVSYFASDDKTFRAISRTGLDHKLVDKGVINSIDRGMTVRVNIVINNLNYKSLPKMVEKLISYGVYHINLALMNPVGTSVVNGRSIAALSFREVMPHVHDSVTKAKNLDFENLTLENFPMCVAGEYREMLSDLQKPEENQDYYNEAKSKPQKCRQCVYYDECSGVWRAHLKQFGLNEITPVIGKSDEEIYDRLFNRYSYEICGILAGVKSASILSLDMADLKGYRKVLEENGFHCLVSPFSYNMEDEKTFGNGIYSLYLSKDLDTCRLLRELDYYHQNRIPHPELKPKEVFLQIGRLLGYPVCCSEFLWGKNEEYERFQNITGREFEDETIYPLMALAKSNSVCYPLNNFSYGFPKILQFFVCSYECENALDIAKRLLDYMKNNYPAEHEKYEKELQKPILFFSSCRIIRLHGNNSASGVYDDISYDEKFLEGLSKSKVDNFLKIAETLKKGNSVKVTDEKISVYHDDSLVDTIHKKHKYDGVLIGFSTC